MAGSCADPSLLEGLAWLSCYLMTGKHMAFYLSFLTVLILLAITAPVAIVFGLLGLSAPCPIVASASAGPGLHLDRARGAGYRFFPVCTINGSGFEYLRHIMCPDVLEPVRQGNYFVVCTIAKLPLNSDPQWLHEIYGFALAVLSFAIVFGAFAGNTFRGARGGTAQPAETAEAYGMNRLQVFWRVLLPQMWIYALPGLSNLWMILIKVTPLLFLLGSRISSIGRGSLQRQTSAFTFPHPDWRLVFSGAAAVLSGADQDQRDCLCQTHGALQYGPGDAWR